MIKFIQLTQATYNSLSGSREADSLYFTTDTLNIYKGDDLYTQKPVVFMEAVPEYATAEDDVIYACTVDGQTSMYVKGASTMDKVGGAIESGAIDSTDAFGDAVLDKAEDGLSSDDTKIPTSGAVKDAIDEAIQGLNSAIVDIQAARAEDNNGTVLTITPKEGEPKTVTISDLFLSAAKYNQESHTLQLTVQGGSTVEIDLTDLINGNLKDISVAESEAFTVELGEGVTLGGYKTGDEIPADTTLETILKKLLMKQVPPTYSQPSVSIANNGGTAAGNYEIGTSVTPNIRATFNQADAGALTGIQFKKGGSNVGESQPSSPATYTEAAFVLESTTQFSAEASYTEGQIKNDNLGEPYPTGHIEAGSKTSSNFTFTPYRQGYFIGSTEDTEELDSASIRALVMKKNGAYSAGTVRFTVPVGAERVIIACPATNTGMTKVLNESALNADVTSTFVKSAVDVEGADAYEAISYNVWSFIPDVPYGQEAVLAITLG